MRNKIATITQTIRSSITVKPLSSEASRRSVRFATKAPSASAARGTSTNRGAKLPPTDAGRARLLAAHLVDRGAALLVDAAATLVERLRARRLGGRRRGDLLLCRTRLGELRAQRVRALVRAVG